MAQLTVRESAQEMPYGLREQILRFRHLVKAYADRMSTLKREMGALEQMLAIKEQAQRYTETRKVTQQVGHCAP